MIKNSKYYKMLKNLKKIIHNAIKLGYKQKLIINNKGINDLVTSMDITCEKYIIAMLNKYYPNVPILSEEFNPKNKVQNTYFTIDPIDGTVNFANNLPMYGVEIGFVENNITKVAVIYIIPTKTFYYAIKDCGAYMNGTKINVLDKPAKQSIVILDGYKEGIYIPYIAKATKYFSRVRLLGAGCVDFAYISSGIAGGLIMITKTPWDYVPGMLLLSEAGGIAQKIDDYVIGASNKETFNCILKIINKRG